MGEGWPSMGRGESAWGLREVGVLGERQEARVRVHLITSACDFTPVFR